MFSGEQMGQLLLFGHLDVSRGFVAMIDLTIDEVQILGHPGVDTRRHTTAIRAPVTHDADLYEAAGCTTHQRATIIPLWSMTNTHVHTHCVILNTANSYGGFGGTGQLLGCDQTFIRLICSMVAKTFLNAITNTISKHSAFKVKCNIYSVLCCNSPSIQPLL